MKHLAAANRELLQPYLDSLTGSFRIFADGGLLPRELALGLLKEMLDSIVVPPDEVHRLESGGSPLTLEQFLEILLRAAACGKPKKRTTATSASHLYQSKPASPQNNTSPTEPALADPIAEALRQYSKQQAARTEAAQAAWIALKADENVSLLCKEQAVVLQRAFALGCADRPAADYTQCPGGSASTVGLHMRTGQFVRHVSGSGGAALFGQPVVVHLPTPCVLHRGEITQEVQPLVRHGAREPFPCGSLLPCAFVFLASGHVAKCGMKGSRRRLYYSGLPFSIRTARGWKMLAARRHQVYS